MNKGDSLPFPYKAVPIFSLSCFQLEVSSAEGVALLSQSLQMQD